jgi:hypothetical protein
MGRKYLKMSLGIETQSHRIVDGGFFGAFTCGFRFGEYAFPTQSMHHMFSYFANKPESFRVNLVSFGEDAFWSSQNSYLNEIASTFIDLEEERLDKFLDRTQGRFDIDQIRSDLRSIPIRISKDESEVSFGKYLINRAGFSGIVQYSIHGGWFGWNNGNYPKSATQALEAIKHSKRPVYSQFSGSKGAKR